MSQFYDQASLVMVPSGYKAGKVYSQKPLSTDGELSFSRASNATRVNSSGLVEKVRTNLLTYSEDFSTARGWGGAGITATANYGTAPDGTTTSTRIVFGSANQIWRKNVGVTGVYGNFNLYIKGTAGQTIQITYGQITDKLVTLTGSWTRFTSNAGTAVGPEIFINTFGGATALDIEVWGGQVETGDIATDPITTLGSAVSVGPVSGLPRLDYSGGCPSLLLEPQRTNYVQFSEQINNPTWTTLNANFTANATTSPDGYTNADKLGGTIGVADQVYIGESLALPSAGTYTYSFFAKADDKSWVRLRTLGFDAPANTQTWFNVADGTIGNDGSGNAKIEAWPNGWYRCSYSFTTTTDLIGSIYAYLAEGNGGYAVNRDGSGIFLWGAQLEAGAYATSYIGPTYSSAVTRVGDAASKTGIASLIGQSEGTLFAEIKLEAKNEQILIITSAAGNEVNRLQVYVSTAGKVGLYRGDASVNLLSSSTYNIGDTLKIAAVYKDNDYALYVNGVLEGTDTSATIPPSPSALYLGQYVDGSKTNSTAHKQALLFKTRLSNADLATLTAL